MSRAELLRNFGRRLLPPGDIVAPVGIFLGGGTLLAAIIFGGSWEVVSEGDGNGRDSQAHIAGLDPADRFQHDYAGYDDSGDDCLERTGYDLADPGHNQIVHIGRKSVDGSIITITPGEPNKYAEPIELLLDREPNKGARPLQPANAETAEILAIHGCETASYQY
jgi:hypothetical protein